jgi:hypothetical protein
MPTRRFWDLPNKNGGPMIVEGLERWMSMEYGCHSITRHSVGVDGVQQRIAFIFANRELGIQHFVPFSWAS